MARRSKRDLATVMNGFLQQYTRRSQRGQEPNDRGYDRKVEEKLNRMKPEDVDELLNGSAEELKDDSQNPD